MPHVVLVVAPILQQLIRLYQRHHTGTAPHPQTPPQLHSRWQVCHAPITVSGKPWLMTCELRTAFSYAVTLGCVLLGIMGAAVLCWHGITEVQAQILDLNTLCLVLDNDFMGTDLDAGTWMCDVELGGFRNGKFQMTTDSSDNLFLQNGQLYINPTLTSDTVPNVLDGGSYTLPGCMVAASNKTACSVSSSASRGTVINPVMSAQINTKGKKSVRFGKVEVRAKLPTGSPSCSQSTNPTLGEIDILEARENGPAYPAQGNNFVRTTLNYGPLAALMNQIFGWYSLKCTLFAAGFHTYTLEWTDDFVRFAVDSRMHRGKGSKTGGGVGPVWGRGRAAPFDQSFYLIIDLAAGGTSGWFPDNKGRKPWFDGLLSAYYWLFALFSE
ncbi:concanavalin A-like lectin/glucanase domain-containing protein [Flammula alnicola]|nr:concanavalin A-like lectin/glucanase domain-containing protein [Flammula alnicola]